MGGSAFRAVLPLSAFPRMPPATYYALKARLTPRIQTLYSVVSTPYEAPEKQDHGDLDLLVCEPRSGLEVPHEAVRAVLNATHVVPMPGNRTSSYAVPIDRGEWPDVQAQEEEMYHQVDVHVCTDRAEWERIYFFHGYGDLGMILGLIARNNGLALGSKGLKIPNHPRPPFGLTESMDEIMKYMQLSMQRWTTGFQTKQQIFEWVGETPLFNPARFQTEGQGIKKVKPERKMYAEFVQWAKEQKQRPGHSESPERSVLGKDQQIQHALKYFGKKEEFDSLAREDANKARLKEGFNGLKVQAWTGMSGEQWKDLKATMDLVRSWVGGEPGILKILNEQGEAGIRELVLRAKEEVENSAHETAERVVADLTEGFQAVAITET
ncbi:hypothetical protein B0H15DRAFT_1016646 [Mycena belliarum]|uniref:Uncharacterized protein n=1 Tax=Mycena belliarum TaxID=1033014 RepID=A0AAD6UJC1_9AGAR|nr:hypothetical protein B0H15DRAFT_1016646 [Mycena belliae]